MGAMTLIVDKRGSKLELSSANVVSVRAPEQSPQRVGLFALRRIIIQGNADVSTGLLRACRDAGVGVVLLPGRGKGEAHHLFPTLTTQVRLRLAQYRCHLDSEKRLQLARMFVTSKIHAQQQWLATEDESDLLKRYLEQAAHAPDLNTLMGVEGAAAACYFGAWKDWWPAQWEFTHRNRRPPRDPVNSLLSLGYTLALGYVGRLLSGYGLDLGIGFLHEPYSNRPSLALDVLEPARPYVDRFVWQMMDERLLEPAHFTISEQDGCRLNQEARGRFFGTWHQEEDKWLREPVRAMFAVLLRKLRKYRDLPEEL